MYTRVKSVQLLIALLKENNIRHLVLSAGTRNVPFVHSVEKDDFFKCYSVVDERSAAFYALGIAKQTGEPVAISCTSSTAACNYLSAITEAYYQNVPILILTGDRNSYYLGQMEEQMINQTNLYGDKIRKFVNLPVVRTEEDEWYCERLINEALIALNDGKKGPVHINVPIYDSLDQMAVCDVQTLPRVNKIEMVVPTYKKDLWEKLEQKLHKFDRILIVAGQNCNLDENDIQLLNQFCENTNSLIIKEHMANITCKYSLLSYSVTETISENLFQTLKPDLVISMGGMISSRIKFLLRSKELKFEHWLIDEDGEVVDVFKHLKYIFKCSPSYFFEYFTAHLNKNIDHEYYEKWLDIKSQVDIRPLGFTNFFVAEQLSKMIPKNSLLHLGILNSTRQMQFFDLDESIQVDSNIGAYGIDGTLSTFLGQSLISDNLCYLILGDLSFLYDMNAIRVKHIKNNIRIVVVNNHGGGEFYYTMGKLIDTIDLHTSAKHDTNIKGWVESLGYIYLSAKNESELQSALQKMQEYSPQGIILEVFTDMDDDAQITREVFGDNINKFDQSLKGTIKKGLKKLIRKNER